MSKSEGCCSVVEELKESAVRKIILHDRLAADLQLSFFASALHSYRHDTLLRPFPSQYRDGDEYNYDSLKQTVLSVGSLSRVHERWDPGADVTSLLHWLYTGAPFRLRSAGKIFDEIIRLTHLSVLVPEPHLIFEVVYQENVQQKFENLRDGRNLLYAFHGSKLENFHSILHFGFHGHMNKNSLYGEGTYFSSEMSVSMPYAPTGSGYDNSLLGKSLSCIAVCEIIDDHQSVKCHTKEKKTPLRGQRRNHIQGSLGGDVPETYYIVRNNEMCRVKYLLLYCDRRKKSSQGQDDNVGLGRSILAFMSRHKMAVCIIVYGLMLLFLGLYNSKQFNIWLKKWLKPR